LALLMIERGDQIDTIPLGKEETVLGSDPGCQVRIAGDRIEARHCRLLYQDGGYVLQRLQETGAVVVNGTLVSEQRLKDGDEIQIGATNLVFVGDTEAAEKGPEAPAAPAPEAETAGSVPAVEAPRRAPPAATGKASGALPRLLPADAAAPVAPSRRTGTQRRRAGVTSVRKAATQTSARPAAGAAAANDAKTKMWIGIGAGGILLLILIAAASSGRSGGTRGTGQGEAELNRLMAKVMESINRGEAGTALQILDNEILVDERYRRMPQLKECRQLRDNLKRQMELEREGVAQAAAFRKKIEEAKKNQTALKRAREFSEECDRLLARYGTTGGAEELRGIKEELKRWIATESQSGWQDDYNRFKDRVRNSYLDAGNYGQAVREWRRYGENSEDPLLRSRIDAEIQLINKTAVGEAARIAGETADRSKLEEVAGRFTGTDGHKIILQKLQSMK